MKFDMGKAWDDTTMLLRDNFGLVASILGLFYFLPQAIIALLVPEIANFEPESPPPGTDPKIMIEAMQAAYLEHFSQAWPYLLVVTLLQYAGTIAVLALFRRGSSHTVGQALATGVKGAPVYIATVLILALGFALGAGIPLGIAFAVLPVLGVLLMFVALAAIFYVSVKLLLVPAVIAMEGEFNPIAAMKRSWRLTKGNSLRIFVFLLVLLVVLTLIALVASLVLGLVFALFGEPVASIGTGLVSALAGAITGGIFLLALAAIQRQLTGTSASDATEAFE